jgi:hypothetical protein
MKTSGLTTFVPSKTTQAATAPRAGAVAGILFAALFGVSVLLIRLSVPANSADASAWTPGSLNRASLALRLIPFAGIFFLWFVGVIRDHLGASEDQFFATVTLGSALVFLALTLAACAVTAGLLSSLLAGGTQALPLEVYRLVRSIVDQAFNTFAVKLASVFMLSLATLWRSTHVMPRWLVYLTYLLALGMLVAFSQSLWLLLLFPAWVLLVSINILITNLRPQEGSQ